MSSRSLVTSPPPARPAFPELSPPALAASADLPARLAARAVVSAALLGALWGTQDSGRWARGGKGGGGRPLAPAQSPRAPRSPRAAGRDVVGPGVARSGRDGGRGVPAVLRLFGSQAQTTQLPSEPPRMTPLGHMGKGAVFSSNL